MTDKQMLETLEALILEDSPDQLQFDLFSCTRSFSEDSCGQLLLFG